MESEEGQNIPDVDFINKRVTDLFDLQTVTENLVRTSHLAKLTSI